MSDEAVVRIVLEDDSKTAAPAPAPSQPTRLPPPDDFAERQRQRMAAAAARRQQDEARFAANEAEFRRGRTELFKTEPPEDIAKNLTPFTPPAPPAPPSEDDFAERQRKRMAAQAERKRQEDAEFAAMPKYQGGYEPAPSTHEPTVTRPLPVKVVEAPEQKLPTSIAPKAEAPYEPTPRKATFVGAVNSELYKAEKARAEASMPPPPPVPLTPTPTANDAKAKGAIDALASVAEALRGTIGGTMGRFVGATLDVTANLRKIKEAGSKDAQAGSGDGGGGGGGGVVSAADANKPKGIADRIIDASPYIAIGAIVAKTVSTAISNLTGNINKSADRYGEYSPVIAQQQAMAEMRTMIQDMRRAKENENELADFLKAQSEMQNKWEDLKMAVMKKIIPLMTGLLEVLTALLGIASKTKDEEIEDPTSILLKGGVEVPGL